MTAYDLSGIRVALEGLPTEVAAGLDEAWGAFAAVPAAGPFLLQVHVASGGDAPAQGPFSAKRMTAWFEGTTARFAMREGSAEVSQSGVARIALAPGPASHRAFALLNLLQAALSWVLPTRPALLVHAAAVDLDGRAFALVGAEGAGKSTWSALVHAAGGRVIHDDLVAVDMASGRPEVMGWPVRAFALDPARAGRWPLAALLLPRHARDHALEPPPPSLLVRARLAGNVPFLSEALGASPVLHAALDILAASAPVRTLAFSPDPGFVPLLRAFRG